MRIPTVRGLIRRRLLVNFRVDPAVVQRLLPQPFRPKLQDGYAIAGICLIRLEQIRPKSFPRWLGVASENAAHRIAVTWDEDGPREGVFIPRRDSDCLLNQIAGGRLFPGEHHASRFDVSQMPNGIHLRMASADGLVNVRVRGRYAPDLPDDSVFGSLAAASSFFERGSLGYSARAEGARLDGVVLRTREWHVEALAIDDVYSSYFADDSLFPPGSAVFDCALIMRDIAHEWHAAEDLYIRDAG